MDAGLLARPPQTFSGDARPSDDHGRRSDYRTRGQYFPRPVSRQRVHPAVRVHGQRGRRADATGGHPDRCHRIHPGRRGRTAGRRHLVHRCGQRPRHHSTGRATGHRADDRGRSRVRDLRRSRFPDHSRRNRCHESYGRRSAAPTGGTPTRCRNAGQRVALRICCLRRISDRIRFQYFRPGWNSGFIYLDLRLIRGNARSACRAGEIAVVRSPRRNHRLRYRTEHPRWSGWCRQLGEYRRCHVRGDVVRSECDLHPGVQHFVPPQVV